MSQGRIILFYYNREQKHHTRLMHTLHKSCPGLKTIFETRDFSRNIRLNQRADAIMFAGMIRGEGNIFKWCRDNNKRFFYLDHAYLERGYNQSKPSSEWMRVTDSGFTWNKFEIKDDDRWNKYFANKYQLRPWNQNRDKPNILVLPPSLATQFLFPESSQWVDQTVRVLRKKTDKNIVVREKPMQPKLDTRNKIIDRITYNHPLTIEQELDQAAAVITFNSAVAVEATIRGIPVIGHATAACAPMNFDLEQIDNPPEPPRQAWLNQLVYHQYRTDEMISGDIWKMLLDNGAKS
jgi:hypothetical protein